MKDNPFLAPTSESLRLTDAERQRLDRLRQEPNPASATAKEAKEAAAPPQLAAREPLPSATTAQPQTPMRPETRREPPWQPLMREAGGAATSLPSFAAAENRPQRQTTFSQTTPQEGKEAKAGEPLRITGELTLRTDGTILLDGTSI